MMDSIQTFEDRLASIGGGRTDRVADYDNGVE